MAVNSKARYLAFGGPPFSHSLNRFFADAAAELDDVDGVVLDVPADLRVQSQCAQWVLVEVIGRPLDAPPEKPEAVLVEQLFVGVGIPALHAHEYAREICPLGSKPTRRFELNSPPTLISRL